MSMTNSTDRVEIITSVQRRRRWRAPKKVRMVEETFGTSDGGARQPDRGWQRGFTALKVKLASLEGGTPLWPLDLS